MILYSEIKQDSVAERCITSSRVSPAIQSGSARMTQETDHCSPSHLAYINRSSNYVMLRNVGEKNAQEASPKTRQRRPHVLLQNVPI